MFAFPISSQGTAVLLVQGPHWENPILRELAINAGTLFFLPFCLLVRFIGAVHMNTSDRSRKLGFWGPVCPIRIKLFLSPIVGK